MKVAAVVITHNEEENIARCLSSLQFCDEIVVVDAESSDRTSEIAKKFTPNVQIRPWKGYSEQKNFAVTLTSCDWILSVDADEEVSSELQEEVKATLNSPQFCAYSVPRKTIHFGRWIRHGGWYPNRLVRLFNKKQGRWEGDQVHELWKPAGEVGALKSDLIHYSFKSLSDQVIRNDKYSTLGALALSREGRRFSFFKLSGKTMMKFFETYFLKRGFLDGYPGLIISVSAAYSVFLKWAKLWERELSGSKEKISRS